MSVVMNGIAVICVVLFVKNTHTVEVRHKSGFFDPKQALQSIKAITKKREGLKRFIILLVVIAVPVTGGPLQGEWISAQ